MFFDKELFDKLPNIHTMDYDRGDKRKELNIHVSTWRDCSFFSCRLGYTQDSLMLPVCVCVSAQGKVGKYMPGRT